MKQFSKSSDDLATDKDSRRASFSAPGWCLSDEWMHLEVWSIRFMIIYVARTSNGDAGISAIQSHREKPTKLFETVGFLSEASRLHYQKCSCDYITLSFDHLDWLHNTDSRWSSSNWIWWKDSSRLKSNANRNRMRSEFLLRLINPERGGRRRLSNALKKGYKSGKQSVLSSHVSLCTAGELQNQFFFSWQVTHSQSCRMSSWSTTIVNHWWDLRTNFDRDELQSSMDTSKTYGSPMCLVWSICLTNRVDCRTKKN